MPVAKFGRAAWNFGTAESEAILAKLDAGGDQVGSILHVGQGMQTGRNPAFVLDIERARYEELHALGLAYERARNSDISAYTIRPSGIFMAFPNAVQSFSALPPDVRSQIERNEDGLRSRAAFVRGNCEWWQYTWPLHGQYVDRPRLICPYLASTNRFAFDRDVAFLGITDTTVLYDGKQPEDLRYLLGVLNSSVATFRFRFLGKLLGGGVFEYYANTVSKLPVPRSTPGSPEHDALVDLVDRRIEAADELRSTQVKDEQELMIAVMQRLDEEIDNAVADLFNLTGEEREHIAATLASPAPEP